LLGGLESNQGQFYAKSRHLAKKFHEPVLPIYQIR